MSSGGNRPVNSTKECEIIEGATVDVKARVVTVKGKRGTLVRDFKHLNVEIYKSKNTKTGKDVIIVSFLRRKYCYVACRRRECGGAVLAGAQDLPVLLKKRVRRQQTGVGQTESSLIVLCGKDLLQYIFQAYDGRKAVPADHRQIPYVTSSRREQ